MSQAITVKHPEVVSRDQWLAARKELLAKEKELTHQRDALSAQRRRLPMVKINKGYEFEGPNGKQKLIDLFEGQNQLLVYHFMFSPDDPPAGKTEPYSEGCSGCSFEADHITHLEHLKARNTNFVMVSRAPLTKIEPFKKRMGWTMPWYSSFGNDFNYDYHVTLDDSIRPIQYNFETHEEMKEKSKGYHPSGEQPGLSVFLRIGDNVYHTYSTYGRGLEVLLTTYHMLDLTPYGRQEEWEDTPKGYPQTPTHGWLRHHDKYGQSSSKEPCCNDK